MGLVTWCQGHEICMKLQMCKLNVVIVTNNLIGLCQCRRGRNHWTIGSPFLNLLGEEFRISGAKTTFVTYSLSIRLNISVLIGLLALISVTNIE